MSIKQSTFPVFLLLLVLVCCTRLSFAGKFIIGCLYSCSSPLWSIVCVCLISSISFLNCRTWKHRRTYTKRWSMRESSVRVLQRSVHSPFVDLRWRKWLRRFIRWEGTLSRYVTTWKISYKEFNGLLKLFAGYFFLTLEGIWVCIFFFK